MKHTIEKLRRLTLGPEVIAEMLWKLGSGIPEAGPAADYEPSPYHEPSAVTRYAGAITIATALVTLLAHHVIELNIRMYRDDNTCFAEHSVDSPKADDASARKTTALAIASALMKGEGLGINISSRLFV